VGAEPVGGVVGLVQADKIKAEATTRERAVIVFIVNFITYLWGYVDMKMPHDLVKSFILYNRSMKKAATKINDNLYYDERSAGGIVFKMEDGKVMWLVVKTMANKTFKREGMEPKKKVFFKFPKGHLKDNEFLKQAALREVEEEGKVKAEIVSKIGSNNYIIWDKLTKKKIIKKVTFFLMKYSGESNLKYYDMENIIDREWLEYDQACDKLAYDSEKVLLGKARIKLDEYLKKGQ